MGLGPSFPVVVAASGSGPNALSALEPFTAKALLVAATGVSPYQASDSVVYQASSTQVVVGAAVDGVPISLLQASDCLSTLGMTALGVATAGRVRGARVNTSLAAPSALALNDEIVRFSAFGYDGVGAVEGGYLAAVAGQSWTAARRTTAWELYVVRSGSIASTRVLRANPDGSIIVDPAVNFTNGSLLVNANATQGVCIGYLGPINGAAAAVGTLTNAPVAGNPAFWMKITIDGTDRYIPCW